MFPRSFTQPLGINPLRSPLEGTSGVGSTNVLTHFSNIVIDLQGAIPIPVYAGFTPGMDQAGIGLLGQAGFFEAFKITFDYANSIYYLETHKLPEWIPIRIALTFALLDVFVPIDEAESWFLLFRGNPDFLRLALFAHEGF